MKRPERAPLGFQSPVEQLPHGRLSGMSGGGLGRYSDKAMRRVFMCEYVFIGGVWVNMSVYDQAYSTVARHGLGVV